MVDAGGNCPADTTNIVSLFKELSAALFPLGKRLTVASQAAKPLEIEMAVAALDPYVSAFHLMSYDYAVSDIPGAGPFSPNAPLYTPAAPGAVQMSIDYTVSNYLAAGVHPSKISVGIPLYAHSWYNPTLNASGSAWRTWGGPTYVQGSCCGPFATTNGGKPGPGAQQCGTLMYSEVLAAIGAGSTSVTTFDNETQSDIAYFTGMGEDGSATPGTWVTYNSQRSALAIARYAKGLGLGGVFIFDSSMDTMSGGDFTYELSLAVAQDLAK